MEPKTLATYDELLDEELLLEEELLLDEDLLTSRNSYYF